ncbi:MAG: DNA polymerase I [Oscillospiraceae bacterium]|nr:DNA polymerase I [Oscillospiraceae bacterium]
MKLLAIDGNSIINRAFYGIKPLSTKDGQFTNGIYGFMNILLRLRDECSPDAVAVAFDLKGPTFRHELYGEYKAGRKGMPDELAQQLPVLKELLLRLGYKIVETPGYEADDILGTLSRLCHDSDGWQCVIATGDRDSLQLINPETTVLLASTKMGRPQTVRYDTDKLMEEYGVSPRGMLEMKALMGDSSDNIPGVAGIGQKTAADLIQKYGDIDRIYGEIDSLDIKQGVRDKLRTGRDSAFLSRELGTICLDVPIETDLRAYLPGAPDAYEVTKILTGLEMFNMLGRLKLDASAQEAEVAGASVPNIAEEQAHDLTGLLNMLRGQGKAYFMSEFEDGFVSSMRFFLNGSVAVVSCGHGGFFGFVKDFLLDRDIFKVTRDSKPLYAYAVRNGLDVRGLVMDVELAGYVLNPSSNDYSPLRLAREYGVALPKAESDAIAQAAVLPALYDVLKSKIFENGQEKLLYEIEMPLAGVLASMELTGFEVDEDGIADFGETLDSRIGDLTARIFSEAGFELNLNSPKQLGEALFERLGIPAKKKNKTGYSTNADVLESLTDDYPIVGRILEYRTLSKLKSTYCDGLLKVVAEDGRIHSTLNQTETRTGRISSTEPNLQNIPVRSDLGREMRRFFRAREGCVLVDGDYSQIELRVLAHIAGDETMIRAFNDGDDIHAITASQVFNMPPAMVTPLMRNRAKAVNFGIVYGIGAFSLAKDIGVTRAEADSYIKGYMHHYAGVSRYMERVVAEAKERGYAETLFARRRYLPELSASNALTRGFGERVARNMPIQGTAADIIKIAMIRVHERLKSEGLRSKIILQVHDELIIESPEEEAEAAARIMAEEMENAAEMKVRLTADVHTGKTWYDTKG